VEKAALIGGSNQPFKGFYIPGYIVPLYYILLYAFLDSVYIQYIISF